MKARTVTRKTARTYESPLREQQSHATRERILRALCEDLAEAGLKDLSVPRVARRAGVTTRTVYRHFPSRDALLDAVDEFTDSIMGNLPPAKHVQDLIEQVPAQFAAFDANAALCVAMLQRGVGGQVRERGRQRRAKEFLAALRRDLPRLPEDELRRARAVLHWTLGLSAWEAYRRVWGLTTEDAAAAAQWAMRLLFDDLRRRDRAAATSPRRPARAAHSGARS